MREWEQFQDSITTRKPSNLKLLGAYAFNTFQLVAGSDVAIRTGLFGMRMLPWYIASASVYITGRIADNMSTIDLMNTIRRAESAGINTYVVEGNLQLPARPTEKELFGPRTMGIEVFSLINSIIFPPASMVYGTASVIASIKNRRFSQELKKEIQEKKLKDGSC